jgi:alpha-D-ribose 1-methylphosphonate 5-triphosphate synthase subunit PhnL
MKKLIKIKYLSKHFVLHQQDGVTLPVLDRVSLSAVAGECIAVTGGSGTGKSTLLKCLYANYRTQAGSVCVRHREAWVDMATAHPRDILEVRRYTMGYVSQFLRVIPRVAALDIVMAPLLAAGVDAAEARARAQALLERLNIPARLWSLPPATFSGGEQQRINIARGFAAAPPVMLLDEPTAALDDNNRQAVIELIREARTHGAALLGIFHDEAVRDAVATRHLPLHAPAARA